MNSFTAGAPMAITDLVDPKLTSGGGIVSRQQTSYSGGAGVLIMLCDMLTRVMPSKGLCTDNRPD